MKQQSPWSSLSNSTVEYETRIIQFMKACAGGKWIGEAILSVIGTARQRVAPFKKSTALLLLVVLSRVEYLESSHVGPVIALLSNIHVTEERNQHIQWFRKATTDDIFRALEDTFVWKDTTQHYPTRPASACLLCGGKLQDISKLACSTCENVCLLLFSATLCRSHNTSLFSMAQVSLDCCQYCSKGNNTTGE